MEIATLSHLLSPPLALNSTKPPNQWEGWVIIQFNSIQFLKLFNHLFYNFLDDEENVFNQFKNNRTPSDPTGFVDPLGSPIGQVFEREE